MTNNEAWERVGHAVRNQRLHLGWTQQEASEHADVSLATWRLIEAAGRDRYQDLTMRGVCRAFGWPNDTFPALLAGGDPPPLIDASQLPKPAAPPVTTAPAPDGASPGRDASLPAGFARKYLALSHREQAMLEGYLEALIDRRTKP